MHSLIIFITITLFLPQIAHSLECWSLSIDDLESIQSNTEVVEKCMENEGPFDIFHRSFSCIKMVLRKDSKEYVLKSCAIAGRCDLIKNKNSFLLPLLENSNVNGECYECTENLCNSTPKQFKATFGIILLIVFSSLIFI